MSDWPELPFDVAQIGLGQKYDEVFEVFTTSTKRFVVQNYYSGKLQLLRNNQSRLANPIYDKDRATYHGRKELISPLIRRVPANEREELSRIWCVYLELSMRARSLRAKAAEINGSAERIKTKDGDDINAALNDDPEIQEMHTRKAKLQDKARGAVKEFQELEDMSRALMAWFGEMVIPYRKERDADMIRNRDRAILDEEALRETARAKARMEIEATMGVSEPGATQVFKKEINHPDKIDQGDPGAPEEVSPEDETKEMLIDQK